MGWVCVEKNNLPYFVENAKVTINKDGDCVGSAVINHKVLRKTYKGYCVSGDTNGNITMSPAKPWLRQVREDLVMEYISKYEHKAKRRTA